MKNTWGEGGIFPPLLFSSVVPALSWIAWDFPSATTPAAGGALGGRKAVSSASLSPGQHKGWAAAAAAGIATKEVAASPPTFPALQEDAISAIRP